MPPIASVVSSGHMQYRVAFVVALALIHSGALFVPLTARAYNVEYINNTIVNSQYNSPFFGTSDALSDWTGIGQVFAYYAGNAHFGLGGCGTPCAQTPSTPTAADFQSLNSVKLNAGGFYSLLQAHQTNACDSPTGPCHVAWSDSAQFDSSAFPEVKIGGSLILFDIDATGAVFPVNPAALGGTGTSTTASTSPTASTTPATTPAAPVGTISNVLFLPGIKGSRLYKDNNGCTILCNSKLWDPSSDNDTVNLYLDANGKSIRSDIYTKEGDVIDRVVTLKVYDSFIQQMNELQASTTYNYGQFSWKPIAYDWRLSLQDIVNNGDKRGDRIYYDQATTSPYIETALVALASSSPTHRVTIVAHSNGGLVAKALMQKLGDAETARLIDKVIFVGVPQSGAPQALGALLYGDREAMPRNYAPFLVSQAKARALAENSPMAYHLMPSESYLRDTQDPGHSIFGFSGTNLYTKEREAYGPSVDTVAERDAFLLAREGGRTKPAADDLSVANVLNLGLIEYANTTHASIDAWVPPVGVSLFQIAGWGVPSISGVDFYDEKNILGATVGHKRQYKPIFVEDGDGVVPVPSALMMGASTAEVQRFWFDLDSLSDITDSDYDHTNIFEAPPLREFIGNLMQGSTALSQFVSTAQPVSTSEKKLVFQLHSPLTLGIYDAANNHTGLNKDGTIDENIPGVEYGQFGEVQYLISPAGQAYRLALEGLAAGSFSLDVQEQVGNTIVASTTFAGVPTTASTTVSFAITSGIADASSLQVDTDGDSTTDITLAPAVGATVPYVPPVPVVTTTTVVETTTGGRPSGGSSIAAAPQSILLAKIFEGISAPLQKGKRQASVLGAATAPASTSVKSLSSTTPTSTPSMYAVVIAKLHVLYNMIMNLIAHIINIF